MLEVLRPGGAVPVVTLAKGVRVPPAAVAVEAVDMALAVVELAGMATQPNLQSTVEPEQTAAALAKLNFFRTS